jgi:hypothetical protein
MFTETQLKVILILLDDIGHSERSLAKNLEMSDSNLNPVLKILRKTGVISRGEARKSTNKHKKEGEYAEFPYYITSNLNALKTLIRELAENKKIYDTGFILRIFGKSKYITSMRKKFGEDVNKSIGEELSKSYPPYTDSFIKKVIHPPLDELFFDDKCLEKKLPAIYNTFDNLEEFSCERPAPKGLELWYFHYLSSLSKEP